MQGRWPLAPSSNFSIGAENQGAIHISETALLVLGGIEERRGFSRSRIPAEDAGEVPGGCKSLVGEWHASVPGQTLAEGSCSREPEEATL